MRRIRTHSRGEAKHVFLAFDLRDRCVIYKQCRED